MNLKKNTRGQALTELAMIFPVMMLAIFAVLEVTNMMIRQQKLITLSREATSAAFRDCGFIDDSVASKALELRDCLDNIQAQVLSGATAIFPDFSSRGALIISLYEHNSAGAGLGRRLKAISPGTTSNSYHTRFDVNNVPQDILTQQTEIAIGEAFYSYVPITPVQAFLTLFGQVAAIPTENYEASLY